MILDEQYFEIGVGKTEHLVLYNIMVSSINSNARYPNNGKDYEKDMIRYGCFSTGRLRIMKYSNIIF